VRLEHPAHGYRGIRHRNTNAQIVTGISCEKKKKEKKKKMMMIHLLLARGRKEREIEMVRIVRDERGQSPVAENVICAGLRVRRRMSQKPCIHTDWCERSVFAHAVSEIRSFSRCTYVARAARVMQIYLSFRCHQPCSNVATLPGHWSRPCRIPKRPKAESKSFYISGYRLKCTMSDALNRFFLKSVLFFPFRVDHRSVTPFQSSNRRVTLHGLVVTRPSLSAVPPQNPSAAGWSRR
jgi:hypothetical protein